MATHIFNTTFTFNTTDRDLEDFIIDHVLTKEPDEGWSVEQFFAANANVTKLAEEWAQSLMPSSFTLTYLRMCSIHRYDDEVCVNVSITVDGPLDTTLLAETFAEA